MNASMVAELLTGIALFLFGMTLMGDGLKKVAGNRLEMILYRLTGNPIRGILFGAGITTVIQSSSATSVMTVGFVNSGLMKVRQAVPVVLGAIFGTSITGWIICLSALNGASGLLALFSTDTLTCITALVGVYCRMFTKDQFKHHLAEVLLGFSVLMVGMSIMSGAVSPLKDSETFISILISFSNPAIGIAVGMAFTCILQSASAAVGILQALTVTGTITFDIALPLIIGISIGAAVPVLLSAVGATRDGQRTALAYLLSNLMGALITGIPFYAACLFVDFSFMTMVMTTISVAAMNSIYRLIAVSLLLPLYRQIEGLSGRLIPAKSAQSGDDTSELLPLEERFVQHPSLAIEQSRSAICDMAQKARQNVHLAFDLLDNYSDEGYSRIRSLEKVVDKYEDHLGTYLLKLTSRELNKVQNASVGKFLHTLTDFERISDHALNLADTASELHTKQLSFACGASEEISVLASAIREILDVSMEAFITNDLQLATRVEPLEEVVDSLCDEMKLRQVERMQHGVCNYDIGIPFNDYITSCERIADHCSNLAVAIISIESDTFDTHQYLRSLHTMKGNAFTEYFEEYSSRYQLD